MVTFEFFLLGLSIVLLLWTGIVRWIGISEAQRFHRATPVVDASPWKMTKTTTYRDKQQNDGAAPASDPTHCPRCNKEYNVGVMYHDLHQCPQFTTNELRKQHGLAPLPEVPSQPNLRWPLPTVNLVPDP